MGSLCVQVSALLLAAYHIDRRLICFRADLMCLSLLPADCLIILQAEDSSLPQHKFSSLMKRITCWILALSRPFGKLSQSWLRIVRRFYFQRLCQKKYLAWPQICSVIRQRSQSRLSRQLQSVLPSKSFWLMAVRSARCFLSFCKATKLRERSYLHAQNVARTVSQCIWRMQALAPRLFMEIKVKINDSAR